MVMNTQSSLFEEVSVDTIQKIFESALQEKIIWETRLLEGGLYNTTYYVEYGGAHQKAVLRLGPVNSHLIMGYEENLMQAEVYVYSVCQSMEIPCSKVLCCDTSKSVINRDFMIVEFIPSIVMAKADLTEEKRKEIYFQMGRYLSKLHQVTGNSFGFVSRVCEKKVFQTWSDALIYEIRDISGRFVKLKGLDGALAEKVLQTFYQNKELLDEIKEPHLLHTDLWEGNVLLDPETLKIAAIIDGDRAVFGDVDFEFASSWMQNPALREGYGSVMQTTLSPNRVRRQQLYQIFYSFMNSYVGYGEYNDKELYENNKKRFLELLENF